MNTRKTLLMLMTLGLCAPAIANNGVETIEFDADPFIYPVDCLGELVEVKNSVTETGHLVHTPSGTVHVINNWHIFGVITGLDTGRVWINKAVSPSGGHIVKNGGSFGFVDNGLAVPLDEGPRWRYNVNYKVKYDQEGESTLEVDVGKIKCLGRDH